MFKEIAVQLTTTTKGTLELISFSIQQKLQIISQHQNVSSFYFLFTFHVSAERRRPLTLAHWDYITALSTHGPVEWHKSHAAFEFDDIPKLHTYSLFTQWIRLISEYFYLAAVIEILMRLIKYFHILSGVAHVEMFTGRLTAAEA